MYTNKFLALCIIAAACAAPCAVQAQAGNGTGPLTELPGIDRPDDLIPKFVDASKDAFIAQARMLAAAGLSDLAAQTAARAGQVQVSATPGDIAQFMEARRAAGAALTARVGSGVAVDAAARKQFGGGVDDLAAAIRQYDAMARDLPLLKKQLRDAGAKGRTGLSVAKALPEYIGAMKQELQAVLVFARANGIDVSAETSALGGL